MVMKLITDIKAWYQLENDEKLKPRISSPRITRADCISKKIIWTQYLVYKENSFQSFSHCIV